MGEENNLQIFAEVAEDAGGSLGNKQIHITLLQFNSNVGNAMEMGEDLLITAQGVLAEESLWLPLLQQIVRDVRVLVDNLLIIVVYVRVVDGLCVYLDYSASWNNLSQVGKKRALSFNFYNMIEK